MKKLFLFSIMFICLIACATKKQSVFTNSDCSKYSYILDSLTYIEFPDEYDYYVEGKLLPRKENNIFKNIEKSDAGIIPCLIEKIKDTTQTNIRYADNYNYTHSDVAMFLLGYQNVSKYPIDVGNILYKEFKKDFIKSSSFFFEQEHSIIFFGNTPKINYDNRIRMYKRLKKWYLKECKR